MNRPVETGVDVALSESSEIMSQLVPWTILEHCKLQA